jgi:acetylglutamate synthase
MCQFPKLDVAGSNPVSRSIFSITYKKLPQKMYFKSRLNEVTAVQDRTDL